MNPAVPGPEPLVLDGVVGYPEEIAARYRRDGYWIDQTFSEMLFETVDRVPDDVAIIAGDTRLSYAELGERVLRLAAGFRDLGIGRGDRVVVQLPNVGEFVPLVFGLFELGAIPVLALAAHERSEIAHFADLAEARAYVTVDRHDGVDLGALAAQIAESSPTVEHTVVLDRSGGGAALETLLAHDPLPRERRCLPGDVAFLQLSGGTTGTSKLIPHTHEGYLGSMRQAVRVGGTTASSVQLVVLPMPHSFAMRSPGFLGALHVGATVVVASDPSPDTAFALVARHGVTETALVPPLALLWLNSSLRPETDLSSLQVVRVGGAKFGAEAARRIRAELGATLQQSYGMAEGLHTFTDLDADEETITTRQGRPTSEADEILVVDDEDRPVPPGSPGHLLTRGPATVRGYYRTPAHDAQVFTADGFYRVGDLVEQDDRGYLTVVGRAKDQINRGGEKVAPEEVENHLLAHPAVHDASVVGVPDDALGERTKAYLVPRQGIDRSVLTVAGTRSFLRERGLAAYKLPDLVEVVETFPSTVAGKVSKRAQRAKKE
ncbi:enterobactin synthase subunit E [Pseudonocardia sp. EC080610-09]|nr:enterobactin synthase subunit E [Pseudonocardia sp. EC080625-04]ALL77782.1 enterobactin synthase subunit E [Pseudonocardia sp. EC080610-09]ALL80697.1 enterobactin synthase subunit E [Pseudonocardia sp. EC080619-01]